LPVARGRWKRRSTLARSPPSPGRPLRWRRRRLGPAWYRPAKRKPKATAPQETRPGGKKPPSIPPCSPPLCRRQRRAPALQPPPVGKEGEKIARQERHFRGEIIGPDMDRGR